MTVRRDSRGSAWDADAAVEELYATHWRRLVRMSVLLVRDVETAEEVVQDSFVAMHGTWNRLRDPERGLAYLRQTVVNRSRSVLRHRAVVARHAPMLAESPRATAEEPADAQARRDAVLSALEQLPQRQREVVVLRYFLDLSEAEIAYTLGISAGAVKSHASRGLAALRPLLEEDRS